MSVHNLIAEPVQVCGLLKTKAEINEHVREIMDMCGLPADQANLFPHELDGGLRQRARPGRAMAVSPKFIVCDEPVSALDVSIQAQILNLLMDLQEQRELSYMFITHDLCVVKHISDEIMVMYMGQVVEHAKTASCLPTLYTPIPRHGFTRYPPLTCPSGTERASCSGARLPAPSILHPAAGSRPAAPTQRISARRMSA